MSKLLLPRLMFFVLALGIFSTVNDPAQAAKSAKAVCEDVAQKAKRTLWNSVRETGDELFCRKGWLSAKHDRYTGCGTFTLVNNLSNKLKNRWNREFDKAGADWATWGPRGIGEEWEEGTIRGGFKRTFFGPALAYNTTKITVVKESGKARGTVTVCKLDYDNNIVYTDQKTFPNGNPSGPPMTFTLPNKKTSILAVVVDTPAGTNSLEYRVRAHNEPTRNNLGPVKGIADLHVHQFMNLAMGGRMYWGSPDGPLAEAVGKEVMTDSLSTNPTVDEIFSKISGGLHVDANRLLKMAKPTTDDEGRFTLGTGGFPHFEDWPSHKDRSHQQVHMAWLKEAHERGQQDGLGLNLMIVSIVNNNILCSAFKALDQYGNSPRFNAEGKITGWESATYGCSDHENVMRQIQALHALENKYPWYRIAMTPWHARQIIADGHLAVIVSLETDKVLSSEGNNYGNWKQQLDYYRALGVTTMQIVHEADNKFAGAALHRDSMKLLQTVHWPKRLFAETGAFDLDARGRNKLGLTKEGEELIDVLMARGMPIDLAHTSHRTKEQIFNRVPVEYGLYDSHTKFERLIDPKFHPKNFGDHVIKREKTFNISEDILPFYQKHRVLLGLRPAPIDIYDAPVRKGHVSNTCPGSSRSFAQYVDYATQKGLPIAYGVDWNTGVSHLGPRFGKGRCFAAQKEVEAEFRTTRCELDNDGNADGIPFCLQDPVPARAKTFKPIAKRNYYYDGLAHIGMLPELTIDLIHHLKTPGAEQLKAGAENYLVMWEQAQNHAARPESGSAQSNLGLNTGCTNDTQCQSGRCSSLDGMRGVCVCNENSDCAKGLYCDKGLDLKRNACVAKKADGASCLTGGARVCQSGNCKAGRCYTANSRSMGQSCFIGDECKVGKCNNVADGTQGTCVCDADSQCGSSQYCDKGVDLKRNACVAKKADGASCLTGGARVCQSGNCKAGRCYTANSRSMGQSCFIGDECRVGKCNNVADGTQGTCVCQKDADCGTGSWCDGGLDLKKNQCRKKYKKGEVCGTVGELGVGHRCLSGQCKVSGLSKNLKCK